MGRQQLYYNPRNIRVSCLRDAEAAAREHQPDIVITLLDPGMQRPSFTGIRCVQQHLSFYFLDKES